MDDQIEKDNPKVQADNQSIAIGEINISGTVTGNITIGHTIVQPADARLRHELGILLKNVETTWIKGVLERSVHEAALLELGLELREEAVDNPWRMVIEGPDQAREILPRGRRIKDIFDEANRLLLILGEPGSGKTTTLLQLARDLIAEVDSAFTQPVPVILNLSTWTNRQQPLADWLVAELNSKYRLPKKDGQRWLKERRILPLLDGLDEVRAENRAACVEKINQLVVDYGLQGLVVCSRIKDYTALNVRLAFYRAIYIQSLTPEQVDEYLNRAGDKLVSLRSTLQSDEALRSMAQSPLILNIMSLAYQNTSAEDLSNPALATDKARRRHLFDTYIARMFSRKVGTRLYKDEHTKQWLSWLARNMQKYNQEVFLMENMQPIWVKEREWRWAYILASRLLEGLSLGLSTGLSAGMGLGMITSVMTASGMEVFEGKPFVGGIPELKQLLFDLIYMSGIGLILGSALGLIGGLSVGLIDWLRFKVSDRNINAQVPPTFWQAAGNVLVVGLILTVSVGLLGGLVVAFMVSLFFMSNSLGFQDTLFTAGFAGLIGLLTGPIAGVIGGLIFGVRGSRQNVANDIQTVEALSWSWGKALKGIPFGLIAGLIVTMIASRLGSFLNSAHPLIEALSVGLCVGLFGPIFNGLKGNIVEAKTFPNQGIRLSRQNAIFAGLIVGSIGALFIGLFFGLVEGRTFGLNNGLIIGPISGLIIGSMGGLIVALWYGGLDVIQHYTLRLILVIQGHTPANYARFLDYAADRIFLQKVGGGYRFIHRLLLEHFAEMGETKKT